MANKAVTFFLAVSLAYVLSSLNSCEARYYDRLDTDFDSVRRNGVQHGTFGDDSLTDFETREVLGKPQSRVFSDGDIRLETKFGGDDRSQDDGLLNSVWNVVRRVPAHAKDTLLKGLAKLPYACRLRNFRYCEPDKTSTERRTYNNVPVPPPVSDRPSVVDDYEDYE